MPGEASRVASLVADGADHRLANAGRVEGVPAGENCQVLANEEGVIIKSEEGISVHNGMLRLCG